MSPTWVWEWLAKTSLERAVNRAKAKERKMARGFVTAGTLRAALWDVADDVPVFLLIGQTRGQLRMVKSMRPGFHPPGEEARHNWILLEADPWGDPVMVDGRWPDWPPSVA